MSILSTDLYQLTMMAGYVASNRHEVPATFELFVRRLPRNRTYLIAAGLEAALAYLEGLRFAHEDIEWLRGSPAFRRVGPSFLDYLTTFRFTGTVWAMREGTPYFPNEPVLRVTAPLAQAQLVETALLALMNYQSAVASKGARIVHAAAGRPVMEFGARRAHGLEAGLGAARAAFIAGCAGTSLVEAGRRFNIPLSGTMAHSWVLAAATERDAFISYANLFKEDAVLLIDTYDTVEAARLIVRSGIRAQAVRLDSGDLLALSREVRRTLDEGGLREMKILASGDLDEWGITNLLAAGAPIDAFGVGTALSTSQDAPALSGVYKLVEIGAADHARAVMKRSPDKSTWPGTKQAWRIVRDGRAVEDVVSLASEPPPPDGRPLLEAVMSDGRRHSAAPSVFDLQAHARTMIAQLPEELRGLDSQTRYAVVQSAGLRTLSAQVEGELERVEQEIRRSTE
jgi:nicotinate phosphoribosyltransferase